MLFSAPYVFFSEKLKEEIRNKYQVVFAFNAPRTVTLNLLSSHHIQIWFTGTCPPYFMDAEMIEASPALRIMATPSTGTNHLDVKYAETKGIKVLSIKESPVIEQIYASSEFSFSLLLAMVNKIPFAYDEVKKGVWREKEHEFRSIELHGKTIGLVGYGRIGKKMARFSEAFGMKILAFDPFKKITENYVLQVSTLEELLTKSDIVSLHLHLNDQTRGMFGKRCFDLMKPGAFFLNTARGEIVDELAMIGALESGKLKAAAVDVISNEHEKNKLNHPVIKYAQGHYNLLVSPHIAGCTVDSETKAAKDLLDQVGRYWNGII